MTPKVKKLKEDLKPEHFKVKWPARGKDSKDESDDESDENRNVARHDNRRPPKNVPQKPEVVNDRRTRDQYYKTVFSVTDGSINN